MTITGNREIKDGYTDHQDGDVFELPLDDRVYHFACCGEDGGGCNLVHDFRGFVDDNGNIKVEVRRNPEETARLRQMENGGSFSDPPFSVADAHPPAKETFMLDSAMEQRVAARKAARRARITARNGTASNLAQDGEVVRVPLYSRDRQFIDGLREKYPPQPQPLQPPAYYPDGLVSAPDLDDGRHRRRTVTRDPMGREVETTEEDDARRVFDRGPVTIQTYDSTGNLTSDPYQFCRPGFRVGDRSIHDEAYETMCRDLADAWRPDPANDAAFHILPVGAVQKFIGINPGDTCQIDSRRGRWEEHTDGLLYCRPLPEGPPPRSDAVPSHQRDDAMPPRVMDAAQAQEIKDRAWQEYVERLSNEWRS
jgi:hypothetical protein